MTNPTTTKSQRVRFEEVTPTHEIVASFNAQLPALVAGTGLPIFPGYDDLDNIQFVYINLPSGNTVVLGQYEDAPEIGVDLYVDLERKYNSTAISTNIAALVVETLRYLAIPRATAVWFHPDYETEIEDLYSQAGEFESIPKIPTAELTLSTEYEPIDCFYHALKIYTREKLPEYWAMLQHNLGLAYFDRGKGERWENLQKSIECFNQSLEVFTQDKFPAKWQINQEDLSQSKEELDVVKKQKLVEAILRQPIGSHMPVSIQDVGNIRELRIFVKLIVASLTGYSLSARRLSIFKRNNAVKLNVVKLIVANLNGADLNVFELMIDTVFGRRLSGVNLIGVNLSGANMRCADLTGADLSGANLSGANLSDADLSGANLSGTNLSDANVNNARFGFNQGISESMREDLSARGAIFDDLPGDRSESRTLVPR
jgi:uncharacterized protein YjbI with pentapeptide repeats